MVPKKSRICCRSDKNLVIRFIAPATSVLMLSPIDDPSAPVLINWLPRAFHASPISVTFALDFATVSANVFSTLSKASAAWLPSWSLFTRSAILWSNPYECVSAHFCAAAAGSFIASVNCLVASVTSPPRTRENSITSVVMRRSVSVLPLNVDTDEMALAAASASATVASVVDATSFPTWITDADSAS